MNFTNKRRLQILKQYSIGWTIAFIFLSIVRGGGTKELGSVQIDMAQAFMTALFMGPLMGIVSGLAQIFTEEFGYKKISFQRLIILRFLFSVFFVITLVLIAYSVHGNNIGLIKFTFEPGSFPIYFYIITVDLFLFCLRQVNLFLGTNNFWNLLRGKFYIPREENRVFMFLDLKDSTKHAEKLGHIQYSLMIQDCFNDLGVVVECEAEIYQYVGDEAILTWKLKDGIRRQNCINAYFCFKNQLAKKADYYQKTYNIVPHFKAGLNAGIVTVTEVGKYKKEIAYHGDTINTAARIQGKCNDFGRELLISGYLKDKLENSNYNFESMDSILLKGKNTEVAIFAVHEIAQ